MWCDDTCGTASDGDSDDAGMGMGMFDEEEAESAAAAEPPETISTRARVQATLHELGRARRADGAKAEGGAEGAPPSPGTRPRMTEKEEDELYMKSAPNRPRLLGPAPSSPLTGPGRLLSAGSKPSRRTSSTSATSPGRTWSWCPSPRWATG